MEVITSTANPTVKAVRALHTPKGRRASGRSLAEGPHLVEALLASGIDPALLIMVEEDRGTWRARLPDAVPTLIVTDAVLAGVGDTAHPQSPIAVFDLPGPSPVRTHDAVVAVGLADPGNLGTIVRTAVAFDFDVVLAGTTTDPWSPKSVRSSAGAVFRSHISVADDPLAACAAAGVRTVATIPSNGSPPARPDGPVAILVGSEAHGLDPAIVAACDTTMTIPLAPGVESLNAAVAAAIAMYVVRHP